MEDRLEQPLQEVAMALRLVTSEERAYVRPYLPDPEGDNSIPTMVAPVHVSMRKRLSGSDSVPEDQPTNPFRIKCLEELRSVDPVSARQLQAGLEELPRVGDVFQGFHLIEVLGEGAFGTVFRAEQIGMASRSVALKVSADLVGETQSLAQLQHTHIMPIYSYHAAGEAQAICMPFYGRSTLADWCRELRSSGTLPTSARMIVSTLQHRHGTLKSIPHDYTHHPVSTAMHSDGRTIPVPQPTTTTETNPRIEKMEYVDAILWIGSCIADGLAHAHQRGIIHRDLKPANVLLTDDGLPMVLDFNLSEDVKIREAELRVRVGGTLPYMSPEQLEVFHGGARELDARTDIYSLGLILFQLLTGHHPYRVPKGSPTEVIEKMLADRKKSPPLLTPYNPAISPAVESIVRRCLHADPAQRYLDAVQLRHDIECHRENRPLKYAPNPSVGERFSKWTRRHPWIKSPVTIGLFCSVGILAGVSSWLWQRDHLKQEEAREMTIKSQQLFEGVTEQLQRGRLQMLDWAATPEQLRQGSDLLGQAIEGYDANRNPDWFAQRQVQILPVEEQTRLRERIEESKRLVERARQLMDPNKPEFQNLIAQRTPERIRSLLEAKKIEDANIPDLSDVDRRTVIGELISAGRYREAVPYLRQSLAKKADDFEAWYQLGSCRKMLDENREALHAFTAALASKPDWIDALWNRSQLHDTLGDYRSALLDLETILKHDPQHFEALIQSAVLMCRLDRAKEAMTRLEPAMNQLGVPTRIWFVRADIRERFNDLAGATADREHGLGLEPNEVQSWNCRGWVRMKTDPEKAIADFQQAEKLDPRSIHALQNQAHVYGEKLNQPAEALAAIDRLLQHHPQYLPAVANRGVYLARLGQVENAVNQAKASLALADNPYSHFRAACIYAKVTATQPIYKKDAFFHLSKSLMQGYGFDMLKGTTDFDPIRKETMFVQLHSFALLMKSMQK